jgi:[acyl-carrier-protein] S-malonyltransferase
MKFALVFPGQGSQSIGMMAAYGDNPIIRKTFDEASNVLGRDLWQLATDGPAEALSQTVNTQPLMLTAAIAAYRLWQEQGGPTPSIVAGHSLGEYSALVAAGVIAFTDAVPLVEFRAQAMQGAVAAGVGGMAAILGLDADAVKAACVEASTGGEVVQAVNFNEPKQTVIAGHTAAVQRAADACKAAGAKRAVILSVSAPFHSTLLQPAADKLRAKLETVTFNAPQISLINNVDVAIETDPAKIRDALVRQAAAPVRWVETMQAMSAQGITAVYECGPGKVLAGLTKRCVDTLGGGAMADLAGIEAAVAAVKE